MSNKKKDILDFFGKKLEEKSIENAPPVGGWEAMENLIIEDEKKKRKGLFLWFSLGVTALLFSISVLFNTLFNDSNDKIVLAEKSQIDQLEKKKKQKIIQVFMRLIKVKAMKKKIILIL